MIYSIIWNIIVCIGHWRAIGEKIVICSNELIWVMFDEYSIAQVS